MDYINVRLKADEYRQLNLPHRTKQKKNNEETKKTEMLRRNGPVVKSVVSVLRLEGSHGGKDLWKR